MRTHLSPEPTAVGTIIRLRLFTQLSLLSLELFVLPFPEGGVENLDVSRNDRQSYILSSCFLFSGV